MPDRISLDVSATLASLSTVRRVLGGLGARLGYSLDDLDDLYLGTEELLRQALTDEVPERLHVDILVAPAQVELTIGHFTSAALRAAVAPPVQAQDRVDLNRLLARTMDEVRVAARTTTGFDVVLIRRRRSTS